MAEKKMTPEELYKFFSALDPGDAAEGEGEEIHYGSPKLIKRALAASKMLLEVQEALGVKAAPSVLPNAEIKEMNGEDGQRMKATQDALAEAESEVDRLVIQNVELKRENEGLKERVRRLQRQVERLYNKSELTSLLGRLDTPPTEQKAGSADPPKASKASVRDEESAIRAPKEEEKKSADTTGGETTAKAPAGNANDPASSVTDIDKELAELGDAKRVPPEEREKKEPVPAAEETGKKE